MESINFYDYSQGWLYEFNIDLDDEEIQIIKKESFDIKNKPNTLTEVDDEENGYNVVHISEKNRFHGKPAPQLLTALTEEMAAKSPDLTDDPYSAPLSPDKITQRALLVSNLFTNYAALGQATISSHLHSSKIC